jgi:hypothetical protein
MNKMCETPLQSATNILKHMATHNISHAFASVGRVPSHFQPSILSGKWASA